VLTYFKCEEMNGLTVGFNSQFSYFQTRGTGIGLDSDQLQEKEQDCWYGCVVHCIKILAFCALSMCVKKISLVWFVSATSIVLAAVWQEGRNNNHTKKVHVEAAGLEC
jgi:hypothetical protein